MLNQLPVILLIVTLVTCPIRCLSDTSGCGCSAATVSQSDCELDCCLSNPGSDSSLQTHLPRPKPNEPCKKCQCLCSGAKLPDHFELAESIHFQGLGFLHHALEHQQPCYSLVQRHHPRDCVPSLTAANIGRSIRCWHNSLII